MFWGRSVDALESFSVCSDSSVFWLKRWDSSKWRYSLVFWTSQGKPADWSQDSLCLTIPVAMALEEVSAASTADWRVVMATRLILSTSA